MLQNKLEKYKKLLNVQNWQIQLIEEETMSNDAEAKMVHNDYRAIIRIKKELTDVEKEMSLVHELLHLVHRDEYDVAMDYIETKELKDMYNMFHERSIEQMAKIIYKLIIIGGI